LSSVRVNGMNIKYEEWCMCEVVLSDDAIIRQESFR